MMAKPPRCVALNLVQRSGFFKQMPGALDDHEFLWHRQPLIGPAVELADLMLEAADDQNARRGPMRQPLARQIRAPAPRDKRPDPPMRHAGRHPSRPAPRALP